MTKKELEKGNRVVKLQTELKYEKTNLVSLIAHKRILEVGIPGSLLRSNVPAEVLKEVFSMRLAEVDKELAKLEAELAAI